MVLKYTLAIFFVIVMLTALSKIGLIGKITPGGGIKDLGVTGTEITAAVVAEPEENNTKVNETEEIEEPDTSNLITT